MLDFSGCDMVLSLDKIVRKLTSTTLAVSSEFDFLKARDLVREGGLSFDEYKKIAEVLFRDESNTSRRINIYRLNIIDWISRSKLDNKYETFVRDRVKKIAIGGGVLVSGVPETIRETASSYPHDLLFAFSTNYSQSRPFFELRDYGTDRRDADDKIALLLSHIGEKALSFNVDLWLRPITSSIRETYQNILDHACIGASQIIREVPDASNIVPAEYWSLQFKRYPYDRRNPVFGIFPRFHYYHENVIARTKIAGFERFSYYLFITMMDDGPGIYRYFNFVQRRNLEPSQLTEIIEKNHSSKGLTNAGGGTMHMVRGAIAARGYINFSSNKMQASYYFSGSPNKIGRHFQVTNNVSESGTIVTIAIPIYR
jgi:hypothetical protein